MSNIKGLNKEESEWVADAMGSLFGHKFDSRLCPYKTAWDNFQNNLISTGFIDKAIEWNTLWT